MTVHGRANIMIYNSTFCTFITSFTVVVICPSLWCWLNCHTHPKIVDQTHCLQSQINKLLSERCIETTTSCSNSNLLSQSVTMLLLCKASNNCHKCNL